MKRSWTMGVVLAGTLVGMSVAHAMKVAAPIPVKILRSAQGSQGPGEDRGQKLIHTAEAWKALWAGQEAPEALGKIDFAKEMVVWVSMGLRNSGGFSVAITAVAATEGTPPQLRVTVAEQSPGPDDMVTMALTTPWAAAVVTKMEGAQLIPSVP